MKSVVSIVALTLTASVQFVWAWGDVSTDHYFEHTNASTQLSLELSPAETVYWDGSSVNLHVTGYGYSCPNGINTGTTLSINCLIDGTNVATTGFSWGCYSVNQVTNPVPLRDLAVGAHTVTVQHTNTIEYYTQTIFSYSTSSTSWGTTYWDYYYDRFHYFAVPCSDSKTFTVKPSPNFRKLQISLTNNLASFTYTGIPTNYYGFYVSDHLTNWNLLSVHMTSTNGRVQFLDGIDSGTRFYRAYGP
jgi:hypothetical protein